jgi:hypothetical protein
VAADPPDCCSANPRRPNIYWSQIHASLAVQVPWLALDSSHSNSETRRAGFQADTVTHTTPGGAPAAQEVRLPAANSGQ